MSLYHGETKVGEGGIRTQPGKFSRGGAANRFLATTLEKSRKSFTGGTINRVAVDVCGELYVDLQREAVVMM